MIRDAADFLKKCFQCEVSCDEKPGKQAVLEVVHPRRRFEQVAIDVQTITPRTCSGCIKVLVIIDVFTKFVRAVPIPDERAETLARVIINDWISVFGPMEKIISDGGPNIIGKVVETWRRCLESEG